MYKYEKPTHIIEILKINVQRIYMAKNVYLEYLKTMSKVKYKHIKCFKLSKIETKTQIMFN